MKKLLISAAILAASSYSAQAADAILHHELVPVSFTNNLSWTGGYIGLETGYQNARFSEVFNDQYDGRYKTDGILGGIYGGYNFEFWNSLILGVDANISYNGAHKNNVYSISLNPNSSRDISHESKLEWSAALRARLGYAMDRWMPYVAGGFAIAGTKNSVYDAEYNYQSDNKTMTGWTIGAGVDYALASNTTLRLEYRHSDYGRKTFAVENLTYKTKVRTDEIRIGVAYRF